MAPEFVPSFHGERRFKRKRENYNVLLYLLPSVLAIVCYWNSLHGEFVHDDVFAIQKNPDVTGKTPLLQVFRNDFWGMRMDNNKSHKSYRPLCTLSFRLDYYLSNKSPEWFHCVNAVLHSLVTLLMTHVFINVLRINYTCVGLASCLFAVHPIHTEAVSGLVGRADILSAAFFLLSLSCYSRCTTKVSKKDINANRISSTTTFFTLPPTQVTYLLASLVGAVGAMLSKEIGITVLGVMLVYDLLISKIHVLTAIREKQIPDNLKPCIVRSSAVVTTGILLLTFRMWINGFEQPHFMEEDNPASFHPSLLTRVLTFNYLLTFNLWLLLCPAHLSYDWGGGSIPLLHSLADPRNLYTVLMYVSLLVCAWRLIGNYLRDTKEEKTNQDTEKTVLPSYVVPVMGVALMCLPFLPASNLFFRVGFVVAERVLYIPSIGFCLLVAHCINSMANRFPRLGKHMTPIFVVLLLVLGTKTWNRNKVWLSRRSLFMSGVRTGFNNAKIHYNMANLLKDEGDNSGAEQHYRQAIKLYPKHASYHLNLGAVLSNTTEAELCYKEALRLYPEHAGALVNLGNIYVERGNLSGLDLIQQALDINPNHVEGLLTMGNTALSHKHYKDAETYITRALTLKPDLDKVHILHALYLDKTGDKHSALQEYRQALRISPHDSTSLFNSAVILENLGHFTEAEETLKRLSSVNKDCKPCPMRLSSIYLKLGRSNDAVITISQASARAPNDTDVNLKYVEVLKKCKQNEKAREILQRLLLRKPNDIKALKFAYTFAREEGRMVDASHLIQELLAVAERINDPELSNLHYEQAEIYRHYKNYDQALKSYRMSLQHNSRNAKALTNAGSMYYMQGNYEKAISYYSQALEIEPNNQEAKTNLALVSSRLKQD